MSESHAASLLLSQAVQFMQSGALDKAEARFRELLSISPGHAEGTHYLGVCLVQMGDVPRGVELIERSTRLDADQAIYWLNLGYVLNGIGNPGGSERALLMAIRLDPRNAAAHAHLGVSRQMLGRPREAAGSFREAIALEPGNPQHHLHLGVTLRDLDDFTGAIAALEQAVQRAPGLTPAWQALADTLSIMNADSWDDRLARLLAETLRHDRVESGRIVRLAERMTVLEPGLNALLGRLNDGQHAGGGMSVEDLRTLAQPLLLSLLENEHACSPALEKVVIAARQRILALWDESRLKDHSDLLEVTCSLAQQCFQTEYVFDETPDEAAIVERLAATSASAQETALLAAYRPIARRADLDRPQAGGPAFDRLWRRQVLEPAEERRLASEIPRLTPINDGVSLAVQQQYEENPYPRWRRAPAWLPQRMSLPQLVASLFPHFDARLLTQSAPPDVLIAGCGSGYNIIDVAGSIVGRILAVDLSLTSLAHALRHCRELGVRDLRIAQADLLELGTLKERFDLVNCGGVLHHLREPLAGWRTLASLLKPGGVMKLALYSAVARGPIDTARRHIAEHGLGTSVNDIRRARRLLRELSGDEAMHYLANSPEFYSATGVRDMLMHVQEHRFTPMRLRAALDTLGLEFIGFDIAEADMLLRYHERFPDDPRAISLENWERFEQDHPRMFGGMYQFWAYKPA